MLSGVVLTERMFTLISPLQLKFVGGVFFSCFCLFGWVFFPEYLDSSLPMSVGSAVVPIRELSGNA